MTVETRAHPRPGTVEATDLGGRGAGLDHVPTPLYKNHFRNMASRLDRVEHMTTTLPREQFKAGCVEISFRDLVIAELGERGWPEYGLDDNDCVVWRGTEGGTVRFGRGEWGHVFEYGTADGSEGGRTSFADGVSPERVVESIDRVRWVIGLRSRPAAKEDPAYVPTRWIGASGHRW
jgi:hypothetical protein